MRSVKKDPIYTNNNSINTTLDNEINKIVNDSLLTTNGSGQIKKRITELESKVDNLESAKLQCARDLSKQKDKNDTQLCKLRQELVDVQKEISELQSEYSKNKRSFEDTLCHISKFLDEKSIDIENTEVVCPPRKRSRSGKDKIVIELQKHMHTYIPPTDDVEKGYICRKCKIDLIKERWGEIVCPECGLSDIPFEINNITIPYDHAWVRSSPGYERENHATDILQFIQCNKCVNIQEVTEMVKDYFAQRRVPMSDVNPNSVKSVLKELNKRNKKMKINKFYKSRASIAHAINELPPVRLSLYQHVQIMKQFREFEKCYFSHLDVIGTKRVNLISYNFIFNRIASLNGWFYLLPYFPIPTSPANLSDVKRIWKYVCGLLNWPYEEIEKG